MKKIYNEILNQIETKRIIAVAGRPAVGKTAFAVSLLEEAVKEMQRLYISHLKEMKMILGIVST